MHSRVLHSEAPIMPNIDKVGNPLELSLKEQGRNFSKLNSTLMSCWTPCWLQLLLELETRNHLPMLRNKKYAEDWLQQNFLVFSLFKHIYNKLKRYKLTTNKEYNNNFENSVCSYHYFLCILHSSLSIENHMFSEY